MKKWCYHEVLMWKLACLIVISQTDDDDLIFFASEVGGLDMSWIGG